MGSSCPESERIWVPDSWPWFYMITLDLPSNEQLVAMYMCMFGGCSSGRLPEVAGHACRWSKASPIKLFVSQFPSYLSGDEASFLPAQWVGNLEASVNMVCGSCDIPCTSTVNISIHCQQLHIENIGRGLRNICCLYPTHLPRLKHHYAPSVMSFCLPHDGCRALLINRSCVLDIIISWYENTISDINCRAKLFPSRLFDTTLHSESVVENVVVIVELLWQSAKVCVL